MNIRVTEWYIKHKNKIMFAVIAIIIIILVNLIIRYMIKKEEPYENTDSIGSTIEISGNNEQNKYNSVVLTTEESIITGESTNQYQVSMVDTINKFVEYCNKGQINEAYDLLSDDCKTEMYPTREDFVTSYYNNVFAGKQKIASLENWNENIYKVEYNDDFLSTGQYNEDNTMQDFIRIIADKDNNYKLNINSYIGRENVNRSYESQELLIKVIAENVFMDYEEFTYEITNNTLNTILLDDKMDTSSMYIEDQNGILYSAYTHEISDAELIISPKQTKVLKIKYYNKYGSEKAIRRVGFSRIILNYNVNEAKKYKSIQIEL